MNIEKINQTIADLQGMVQADRLGSKFIPDGVIQFEMGDWITKPYEDGRNAKDGWCGTAACIAGVIVLNEAPPELTKLSERVQWAELQGRSGFADAALGAHIDLSELDALFDPVAATTPARRLAERQLLALRGSCADLDSVPPFTK